MNILIADDDAGTRLLVSAAVERLGHSCAVAEDGTEAWRRYQQELPDVVITDWQMPGMDGTALAEAIRNHGAAPYAYVIVLTGAADEGAARRTMELGADDLLLKPLDAAQLERKLIAAERGDRAAPQAARRRPARPADRPRKPPPARRGPRRPVRPGRLLRPRLLSRAVQHRLLQAVQRHGRPSRR
jgi:CheY-like chemotaxis protein